MDNSKWVKCALASLVLPVAGCYWFQDPRQKAWHEQHWIANRRLSAELREPPARRACVTRADLEKEVGAPDVVTTPEPLNGLLEAQAPETGTRTMEPRHIMDLLYTTYRNWHRDARIPVSGSCQSDWMTCPEFMRVELLLYDESLHFKHPMKWGLRGFDAGFTCHIYLAERGCIIKKAGVVFWPTLQYADLESPSSQSGSSGP